ncbi:hypothetical protein [Leptospira brenneri]|uniref:Glycosyltransferase RgtA/B/C/D-like domain-containing protein n=1 Tax=Leptospira brenneri TaxID=2023182 RepID=A0A2M9Y1N5_9LEPT|nr:hypothetical protein [Leptospira brenneri]PJZ45472.1 hypothetical protein CH361_10625 [Leptospira brenneri]TGK91965.1 hypothetical protein EHQ30_17440 [Leptospira brenneri]
MKSKIVNLLRSTFVLFINFFENRELKIPQILSLGIVLALFGYAFRYFTFSVSVLDWDEITYFIMGKGILLGKIPYVDLWDIKPIGIYLIHAISLLVLPYHTEVLRWTSFLHLLGLAMVVSSFVKNQSWIQRLFCGTLVLYFFSRLSSGLSANSEIYFLFYEWLGISFFFRKNSISISFFLLGIAFLIKYIIFFDVVFLGLYALWKRSESTSFLRICLEMSTFVIPIGTSILIYYFLGHSQEFFDALLTVSSKHQTNETIGFPFGTLISLFWPLFFLGFVTLLSDRKFTSYKIVLVALTLTALLGASYTGYYFQHYFLALVPPLAILATPARKVSWQLSIFALFLVLYSWNSVSNRWKKDLSHIPDHSRIIAENIQKLGGGTVFVASGVHATYIFLNQLSPTEYVQPVNYIDPLFSKNFDVDVKKVFREIKGVDFIQWCHQTQLEKADQDLTLNQDFVHPLQILVKENYPKKETPLAGCDIYYK